MEPHPSVPGTLYHLALRHEWDECARSASPYRRSTIGRSLEEVGFVHCSLPGQVQAVADMAYRGRDDVVLLAIDPSRLGAEVRFESPPGGAELFPHVYGPLPVEAVVWSRPVPLGADGRLAVGPLPD